MVLGVSEGTHTAQTSLGSGVSLGAAFRNKNYSFPGITAKTRLGLLIHGEQLCLFLQ